jgi:hypothetical protein
MKISAILDHSDSGHMALTEFQHGFVWNCELMSQAGYRCLTSAEQLNRRVTEECLGTSRAA